MLSWQTLITAIRPFPGMDIPTFETWATDQQTYANPPVWPKPEAQRSISRFQVSRLLVAHLPAGMRQEMGTGLPPCSPPSDSNQRAAFAAGNFPPKGCIAEEVRRNKPGFDYIAKNKLYSQEGLVAAYEKWVESGYTRKISFPSSTIALKADWVPVTDLTQWLSNNGVTLKPADVGRNYYVVDASGNSYALVGIHVSSKVLPNWLWADFEHRLNPGRCDTMGCDDKFGIVSSSDRVPPATDPNTQYGTCKKSKELLELFAEAGIGDSSVWNNYCLKGTQIGYLSPSGDPVLLGNSVIERLNAGVPISRSSCISCHSVSSFDSSGGINAGQLGEFPIGEVKVESGYMPYDFLWGVVNVPEPPKQPKR